MNRHEVKEKLDDFRIRIENMTKMYEEKPVGYRDRIKDQYAELMTELLAEHARFQAARGRKQASRDEMEFYFPTVKKACLELKKVGSSTSNEKMKDCLHRTYLEIWFQLNNLGW